MWITPLLPVALRSGGRVTWLKSQRKLRAYPAQFRVEINILASSVIAGLIWLPRGWLIVATATATSFAVLVVLEQSAWTWAAVLANLGAFLAVASLVLVLRWIAKQNAPQFVDLDRRERVHAGLRALLPGTAVALFLILMQPTMWLDHFVRTQAYNIPVGVGGSARCGRPDRLIFQEAGPDGTCLPRDLEPDVTRSLHYWFGAADWQTPLLREIGTIDPELFKGAARATFDRLIPDHLSCQPSGADRCLSQVFDHASSCWFYDVVCQAKLQASTTYAAARAEAEAVFEAQLAELTFEDLVIDRLRLEADLRRALHAVEARTASAVFTGLRSLDILGWVGNFMLVAAISRRSGSLVLRAALAYGPYSPPPLKLGHRTTGAGQLEPDQVRLSAGGSHRVQPEGYCVIRSDRSPDGFTTIGRRLRMPFFGANRMEVEQGKGGELSTALGRRFVEVRLKEGQRLAFRWDRLYGSEEKVRLNRAINLGVINLFRGGLRQGEAEGPGVVWLETAGDAKVLIVQHVSDAAARDGLLPSAANRLLAWTPDLTVRVRVSHGSWIRSLWGRPMLTPTRAGLLVVDADEGAAGPA